MHHRHLLFCWLYVACNLVAIHAFVNYPTSPSLLSSSLSRGVINQKIVWFFPNYRRYQNTPEFSYFLLHGNANPQDGSTEPNGKDPPLNDGLSPFSSDSGSVENFFAQSQTNNDEFINESTQQQPKPNSKQKSNYGDSGSVSARSQPQWILQKESASTGTSVMNGVRNNENDINDLDETVRSMMYQRLQQERAEIEKKHKIELTRLKLTLTTTREELSDMEEKANTLETLTKNLESNLTTAMSDNQKKVESINNSWEQKLSEQIKILTEEKDQALALVDEKLLALETETNRAQQMENQYKELETSLSMELENKKKALSELEFDLTSKYKIEMDLLLKWARQNATELDEYRITTAEQMARIELRKKEEKLNFEKELGRLTYELGVVTRKLKNAEKYEAQLRQEQKETRLWVFSSIRKSREKSAKELKNMAKYYSDEIEALMNATRAKEALLEKQRDDALKQYHAVQLSNERLRADINNKTLEWDEVMSERKEEAAKEMVRLEKEWANRIKAVEAMTIEEINRIEEETTKDKLIIKSEWSDRLQLTVEKGRKERENLLSLHEKQLTDMITSHEERLTNVRELSKQIIKLLAKRSLNRYSRLEERMGPLKSTRLRVFNACKKVIKRKNKKSEEFSNNLR